MIHWPTVPAVKNEIARRENIYSWNVTKLPYAGRKERHRHRPGRPVRVGGIKYLLRHAAPLGAGDRQDLDGGEILFVDLGHAFDMHARPYLVDRKSELA